MAEQAHQGAQFITQPHQPLIGIFLRKNNREVVQYFTEEKLADATTDSQALREVLNLAGCWRDLDWDEVEQELHRLSRPF